MFVASSGLKEEADVVMQVSRIIASRRDRVHVEVENIRRKGKNVGQAGFFMGLANGDAEGVGVAVGMPAQLQPFVEFGVMSEQCPL